MKIIFAFTAATLIIGACNNDEGVTTKTVTSKDQKQDSSELLKDVNRAVDNAQNNKDTRIENNIQLQVKDVKVAAAYLVYGDDESPVPASNETTIGRPVKVRLEIEEGWIENNNEISIGASERIETDNNLLVLDADDLFKDYPKMPAAYGGQISLKAVITEMEKSYNYFNVYFRVWDKNGTGEIKGSYKLYIKQ